MNDYEKEIFQWLEDAGLNPERLGYDEHSRYFPPRQMAVIIKYLGEL